MDPKLFFLIIWSLIYEQISETTVCQVYHLSFDNVATSEVRTWAAAEKSLSTAAEQ